jgi:hypothetical protein
MSEDKTFTLYWRTGDRDVVIGPDIAKAMTLAGYGGGSIRALDFYANGDDRDYRWDGSAREWVVTPSDSSDPA